MTDRVMTGDDAISAGASYELSIKRDYKVSCSCDVLFGTEGAIVWHWPWIRSSISGRQQMVAVASNDCHSPHNMLRSREDPVLEWVSVCQPLPHGRSQPFYNLLRTPIGCACCNQVGLPESARTKRFIPFSDGRRDCVGQALGRLNYTSTLARLLGNFTSSWLPRWLSSLTSSLFTGPG